MRTRNWSIRSKIIAMVAVPLAALLALWVFATVLTAGPAFQLLNARSLLRTVGDPGAALVTQLQAERRQAVVFLSRDGEPDPSTLAAQRRETDGAVAVFRASAGSAGTRDAAGATLNARIRQLFTDLDGLAGNRGHIDRREVDPVGAQGVYNSIVNSAYQMLTATHSFRDEQLDREAGALILVARGGEYLSRTDSLLAAADAAGEVSGDLRDELLQSIGTSRLLLTEGVTDLPERDRTAFQQLSNDPVFTQLLSMQEVLVARSRAGAPAPIGAADWQPAYNSSTEQLHLFERGATDALGERATPIATAVLARLGVAALLGLLAVIVTIAVSVRVGRSLVARLVRLRGEALELADERLPAVVRRLRRGEAVDVAVETPPLEYGEDEIGQVGQAFTEVQRTAVQSAVEEARVRRGLNEVFLNIARRSQTLLHRQLALLDRMERRETGPDELEDLYRVDHLATRMRRHAEDLVILAGAAPGRGWRNPVPLIDVVRGAISEVEDYKRIDINSIEASAVVGRAVGDVIHLLAELLENATSFSPPQTRVLLTGQVLPNGYAIEIEDRGLGISPDTLVEANRKLAEPPDFDPSDSARLGLFVVAQLAHRHGIKVSLRASAYAGVTAIVLVPADLIAAGAGPAALTAGPSAATAADRDGPLVGTGADDPNRHPPAALSWQDAGDRTRPLPGRAAIVAGDRPAVPSWGGPPAGSTPAELTPDGLVRRRRTTPSPRPADEPGRTRPAAEPVGERRSMVIPVQRRATSDGLPRRVRQANLAPQLRAAATDDVDASATPSRSPEQVRNLMSSLQRGTTTGRQAAGKRDPVAVPPPVVPPRRPAHRAGSEDPGSDKGKQ